MNNFWNIKNLLITILCITFLSCGSYIMYKILDPVDKELIERDKIYFRLYIEDDGEITDSENEYEVLKFETSKKSGKLVSYVKDDLTDELKYVLFNLDGLFLYNVKTKTIEPLISSEDYEEGEYYLHLSDDGNDIVGYFFIRSDETKEYYKKLSSEKNELTELKVNEKRFVGNNFGNNIIISKGNECEKGMYIRTFFDDKPLIEGKVIKQYIVSNKVYYQVQNECNSTLYDLYDSELNLIKKDLDSIQTYLSQDYYYRNNNNTIVKYDYNNNEIEKNIYQEVLELHDGFALLRDDKNLYILNLSNYKQVKVSDLSDDTNDVNDSTNTTFSGKHFHYNHHGDLAITLRIRNINYNIKSEKVS